MKIKNLSIVAAIIATMLVAMMTFEPTTAVASRMVTPAASATPRKISRRVPVSTKSPVKGHVKGKVAKGYSVSEAQDMMNWRRKPHHRKRRH